MGRKIRKSDLDFDPYDDFDDLYDEDIEIKDIARDIYSTEWGNYSETEDRSSTRRKIERRNDMRKLYSELNDWEEFGDSDNW